MGLSGAGSAAADAHDGVGLCWICQPSFLFFASTVVADTSVVGKVGVAVAAVKAVDMVATVEDVVGGGTGGSGIASSTAVGGIV